MERRKSIWWLGLFWIPVVALVLGVILGCASMTTGSVPIVPPSQADLLRLVAQELDADPRFDSFGASENGDARAVAALFRPVVADVSARECRAAYPESLDCTLDVVLRFPAMGGRQSHTTWERRLRHTQGAWQIVVQLP